MRKLITVTLLAISSTAGFTCFHAYAYEMSPVEVPDKGYAERMRPTPPEPVESNPYRGGWTTFYGDGMSTSIGPDGHSCYTMYGSGMSTTDCR